MTVGEGQFLLHLAQQTRPVAIIVFDIPREDDPEMGLPSTMEHGCDDMQLPDGQVEFHYNFLSYTGLVDQEAISARSDIDDIGKISVFISARR